jgi:hypothetical protein
MHATFPAHILQFDYIILIIFVEEYKYRYKSEKLRLEPGSSLTLCGVGEFPFAT